MLLFMLKVEKTFGNFSITFNTIANRTLVTGNNVDRHVSPGT